MQYAIRIPINCIIITSSCDLFSAEGNCRFSLESRSMGTGILLVRGGRCLRLRLRLASGSRFVFQKHGTQYDFEPDGRKRTTLFCWWDIFSKTNNIVVVVYDIIYRVIHKARPNNVELFKIWFSEILNIYFFNGRSTFFT